MTYEPDFYLQQQAIVAAVNSFMMHDNENIKNKRTILVVDFNQHSSKTRMYLYDMYDINVLEEHHVAHGINSCSPKDKGRAVYFSNGIMSKMSCLGAFVTQEVYKGKHGKSLRINGLDDTSSNARQRAIVIHAADYMTNSYIDSVGRAGRSEGCFALDPSVNNKFIDKIKEGMFMFAHYKVGN